MTKKDILRKIEYLEKEIWILKNPPKFKVRDVVKAKRYGGRNMIVLCVEAKEHRVCYSNGLPFPFKKELSFIDELKWEYKVLSEIGHEQWFREYQLDHQEKTQQ